MAVLNSVFTREIAKLDFFGSARPWAFLARIARNVYKWKGVGIRSNALQRNGKKWSCNDIEKNGKNLEQMERTCTYTAWQWEYSRKEWKG